MPSPLPWFAPPRVAEPPKTNAPGKARSPKEVIRHAGSRARAVAKSPASSTPAVPTPPTPVTTEPAERVASIAESVEQHHDACEGRAPTSDTSERANASGGTASPQSLDRIVDELDVGDELLDEVLDPVEVRTCRNCGCTDDNCSQCIEKTGEACYWVDDDLCSACLKEVRLPLLKERHALYKARKVAEPTSGVEDLCDVIEAQQSASGPSVLDAEEKDADEDVEEIAPGRDGLDELELTTDEALE